MTSAAVAAADDWWGALAVEADKWATYQDGRGEYSGVARAKAETYRRAAESLRMEEATGMPHCVCCLRPLGLYDRHGRSR